MSSKKELEDRIAALEVEIALLRAQLPIPAAPTRIDPCWYPYQQPYPHPYPIVWCGTSTADNTVTINGPLSAVPCPTL